MALNDDRDDGGWIPTVIRVLVVAAVAGLAMKAALPRLAPRRMAGNHVLSVSFPIPENATPTAAPGLFRLAARPTVTPVPVAPSPTPDALGTLQTAMKAVVGIRVKSSGGQEGLGSGFLVSSTGHIITNQHVVANAYEFEVILWDGSRLPGSLLSTASSADLALVKIPNSRTWPSLEIGTSAQLRPGQPVYAVGFPISEKLGHTVTRGIVSGLRPEIMGRQFVQHDAAINPGNSGGPLLDMEGRVVGVNTWKVASTDRLGFAVTAEDVSAFLKGHHR